MAQSLSPCDLSPCDLGWKSADRSGIGRRADKNSLLIQHGIFDRSGIRESAEHSWSSLSNDSSLTGILEVKLVWCVLIPCCSPPHSLPSTIAITPLSSHHSLFYFFHLCVIRLSHGCSVCSLLAFLLSAFLPSYLWDWLRPINLPSVCSQAFAHSIPPTHLFLSFQNIFTAFFPVWSFSEFPSRK